MRHALRSALLGAATFIAAAAVNGARAAPGGDRGSTGGCALSHSTPAATPTQACVSCHGGHSGSGHPVDLDYGRAHASRGGALSFRSPEEAVRRGVLLPNGKITCLTCHDPGSPWKHHLALPPGAKPIPAVNPRDARTYAPGAAGANALGARHAEVSAALELAAKRGERPAISPKPLCLSCHALD